MARLPGLTSLLALKRSALLQRRDKAVDLRQIHHRLLEAVFCVEEGVGLIAIFVQPSPSHLLFAAPCDAYGAVGGVAGDVDVMSTPRTWLGIGPGGDVPWLTRLNLILRSDWQLQAKSHAHVREDRAFHFRVVCEVHLCKGTDLEVVLANLPTFLPPEVERIEHYQAGVLAPRFFEIFPCDLLVGDHHYRSLLDVLEPQDLMCT